MAVEYEAMFIDIDPEDVRKKLEHAHAVRQKPETVYRRYTIHLPEGVESKGQWLRVRDEGDVVTMSWKKINEAATGIERQEEIELVIDDMEKATQFLEKIGCCIKSYQETRREIWRLDAVEVVIDWWPHLAPVVEIEGESEVVVRAVVEKLGFDYSQARFESIDYIYAEKYNHTPKQVCDIPRIVFDEPNPFI